MFRPSDHQTTDFNLNNVRRERTIPGSECDRARMSSNGPFEGASTRRQGEHDHSNFHNDARSDQPRREERRSTRGLAVAYTRDSEPKNTQNYTHNLAMAPPNQLRQEAEPSGHRYPTRTNPDRRRSKTGDTSGWEVMASGSEAETDSEVVYQSTHPRFQQYQQESRRPNDRNGNRSDRGHSSQKLTDKIWRQRDEAVQKCNDLEARVQHLTAQKDKNFAELRAARSDLDKEKKKRKEGSNSEFSELKREYDHIQRELQEERGHTQSLEATVRDCQATQLRSVESTQWMPLTIPDIQHQLDSIQTRIRQWAKKFIKISFEEFMQSPDPHRLIKGLIQRLCVPSEEKLVDALLRNETMRKPGRASGLLIGAAISTQISNCILNYPFFAFGSEDDEEELLSTTQGDVLWSLIELIRETDVPGAEALRCQVLRLLDPPMTDKDREITTAKAMAKNSRGAVSHKLAGGFMAAFPSSLNDGDAQGALSVLEGIFEDAAELSWNLWTRKARLGVDHALPGEYEYHALHLRELDEDPEALEGRDIVLMCDATITLNGDAEGQDFQKRRVVKKAIVWMG